MICTWRCSAMSSAMIDLILRATLDTLYMVAVSGVVSALVGIPLGVLLYVTRPGQVLAQPGLNGALGIITNVGRSIPFIILMVAIIPFTRMLVGTSIGTNAAAVPLTIAAIPFIEIGRASCRERESISIDEDASEKR